MGSSEFSLISLMSNNSIITERIKRGAIEVKKDKKRILSIAEQYNEKYKRDIEEGTFKKQKLLSENVGKTEEEVISSYGKFIPTVYTPILNFLYFFMMEGHDVEREILRNDQDEEHGQKVHKEMIYENVQEPDSMETFIYGNCTHKTYQTIKKLKKLSCSMVNENESAAAYIACIKLCKKYNLEFDKIPV